MRICCALVPNPYYSGGTPHCPPAPPQRPVPNLPREAPHVGRSADRDNSVQRCASSSERQGVEPVGCPSTVPVAMLPHADRTKVLVHSQTGSFLCVSDHQLESSTDSTAQEIGLEHGRRIRRSRSSPKPQPSTGAGAGRRTGRDRALKVGSGRPGGGCCALTT